MPDKQHVIRLDLRSCVGYSTAFILNISTSSISQSVRAQHCTLQAGGGILKDKSDFEWKLLKNIQHFLQKYL